VLLNEILLDAQNKIDNDDSTINETDSQTLRVFLTALVHDGCYLIWKLEYLRGFLNIASHFFNFLIKGLLQRLEILCMIRIRDRLTCLIWLRYGGRVFLFLAYRSKQRCQILFGFDRLTLSTLLDEFTLVDYLHKVLLRVVWQDDFFCRLLDVVKVNFKVIEISYAKTCGNVELF
jgi:hypothetical protein